MRKSTKWFVYGIAILIIAAAILFVWVYPQLDRSAQQTIRDIQTGALADDTQTESPTVDDHTEADNGGVPTAAPEALSACSVLGKPFMTQKRWGKVPVTIR